MLYVVDFKRGQSIGEPQANRMGAWLGSQVGATPPSNAEFLTQVRTPSR